MISSNAKVRFTYEDYKSLPEDSGKRYELLDGDLVMAPSPTALHQYISSNLELLLIQFVREHSAGVVLHAPIDIVLGSEENREVVQPDIVVIATELQRILAKEEINNVPDLVVEILSPGTARRDRGYKKALYGRYGVREYWLVDPQGQFIEAYALDEHGLQLRQRAGRGETLTCSIFPQLSIPLDKVFEDL